MKPHAQWLMLASLLAAAALAPAQPNGEEGPQIYVPYRDLAAVIDPAAKAVLMDRKEFTDLLAKAAENARTAPGVELGQITQADYTAAADGEKLLVTGALTVVSMSDKPVAVDLDFAGIALSSVTLDGKPAPLGYTAAGKTVLIVTGKGPHAVALSGSARLQELPGGGTQFSVTLPRAAAGTMSLSAPGDLEIHSTVPVAAPVYDKQADRTTAVLTVGGHAGVSVVLMGNGRQEALSAILLGESATTIQVDRTRQVLHCLYTVQVLRRGVRELVFRLPESWTITDVDCPNLVRWSVDVRDQAKWLTVRLRSAARGTQALHLRAIAARAAGAAWRSPRVDLQDAAFQRGFLLVDTGGELVARGETLADARREDAAAAAAVPGLLPAPGARMFYHWGTGWSVGLDLADVALRTASEERQTLTVSAEQLTLWGSFEITAIGRDLFDIRFELPLAAAGWDVDTVTVGGRQTGFEYRVDEAGGKRTLRIELARPVRPEGVAQVVIGLRKTPANWNWQRDASARQVATEWIRSTADTVSGLAAVVPRNDLDVAVDRAGAGLKPVTVGRMASLGLGGEVQAAYTYSAPPAGPTDLQVTRRKGRIAADAVGLVTVKPTALLGDWRIRYVISRANVRTLQLLAAEVLGRQMTIEAAGRRFTSTAIEPNPPATVPAGYNLWTLTLDGEAAGAVDVHVRYSRPGGGESFSAPLVRPFGADQASEVVAIQATEELAVEVWATGARPIDSVDLPTLPVRATRLLAAFRLEGAATAEGRKAGIDLKTTLHDTYAIPAALVSSADLTTYLGPMGGQRTLASLRVVNAGMQFLSFRLPAGAELWSVSVAGQQAKPKGNPGGGYQVALPRSARDVPVRIVYASPPPAEAGRLGSISLPGLEINQCRWRVVPPPGCRITSARTSMQTEDTGRPTPAHVEMFRLLGGTGALGYAHAEGKRSAMRVGYEAGEAAPAPPAGTLLPRESDVDLQSDLRALARSRRELAEQHLEAQTVVSDKQAKGRYTLPVDLVAVAGAGPAVNYAGLGAPELAVEMTRSGRIETWNLLGFLAAGTIGVLLVRAARRFRVLYVVAVLIVSSLVGTWWPAATWFTNGAFVAAWCLIPFYLLAALWRAVRRRITGKAALAQAAVAGLLAAVLLAGPAARAADAPAGKAPASKTPPAVIPYEGDPTQADQSKRVLIPYDRYVRLWNQAHPDEPIETVPAAGGVSLAAVHYDATVQGERMHIVLTTQVKTLGASWIALPMPMSGLAVQRATLAGEPAQLRVGPKGMVLMLRGGAAGDLRIEAVTTPTYLGRRGSVVLSLPPLPGGVMTVALPDADLVLEAPGIAGAVVRKQGAAGNVWTVPLGTVSKLSLRWMPQAGAGAADQTLSAEASHDVYAFHWALVGVSRLRFTFSAGKPDRFVLLLPEKATLTALSAANLRDFRAVGQKVVDGHTFQVIEARLHRPAVNRHELTVRWLTDLPAPGRDEPLVLPRADGVGRESGEVTLHAAGGVSISDVQVTGGRRAAGARAPEPAGTPAAARDVGRYYWPYRPFSLRLKIDRVHPEPAVRIDQLVRIAPDRIELLANAAFHAERGRLFGASFLLPDGYDVLSVVGQAVGDHYEQPAQGGRRLHVDFRSAVTDTQLALVLVRKDPAPGRFDTPMLTAIDPAGTPLPKQTGRLAVQLDASLDAQTAASGGLKPIAPSQTGDWLDKTQVGFTRFAYRYQGPGATLALDVRRLPANVRVEVLGGLTVQPTAAWYTYRLRYHIEGSPIDTVRFTLPASYAPHVAVASPALRGVTTSDAGGGQTRWTVALISQVTGVLDVTVNFGLPIEATTTALEIPRIRPEAGAGYRGIVAVQNFSPHELTVGKIDKLSPMTVSEQALLLDSPVRQRLQYIYQSFTDDWEMSLKLTPARQAQRIQAVVDLMEVTTFIDRSGQCRTSVRLDLQNRSEQFLTVNVPEGLKLWSARVAGQPVKPVTADGKLLIPLVKTSPGGLPYEVLMYFAGRPLPKLDTLTRLQPPAVAVQGVPVMRTTWSLRLPPGYQYRWRGGNMSSVTGAAEMMVIKTEAKVAQVQRLLKFAGETRSYYGRKEALTNVMSLNKKLAEEGEYNREYVAANQQVIAGSFRRLSERIAQQYEQSEQFSEQIKALDQGDRDEQSGNINDFLNSLTPNTGLFEADRNAALAQVPDFVKTAARKQVEVISGELSAATATIAAEDEWAGRKKAEAGKDIAGLLGDTDRDGKEREVLGKLDKLRNEQKAVQEKQLQQELAETRDNRLQRYYARQQGQGAQGQTFTGNQPAGPFVTRPATQPAQSFGEGRTTGGRGRGLTDWPGQSGWGTFGGPTMDPAGRPRGGVTVRDGSVVAKGTDGLFGDLPPAEGTWDDAGVGGQAGPGGGYVAAGTFSLPVSLPEGGVRLDFDRPFGDATLSVWAVRADLVHRLYATTGILMAVVVLAVVVKLLRRFNQGRLLPPKAVIVGYIIAIGVLVLAAGGLGLCVGIGLALIIELIRRPLAAAMAAGKQ